MSVRPASNNGEGDLDGDGVVDTVQFIDLGTSEAQIAEGIRVCGTSRELVPYFVQPSNGNFGAIVVPFADGPAGVVNRPPVEGLMPEDVWLFGASGNLLPPGMET